MKSVNELTVVEIASNPVSLFTDGGVDDFLKKAREEATKEVFDVTTAKGRKGIASQANNVAKLKVSLDGAGKNLVSGWKEKAKAVDSERKKIRDNLDALKAEIRKPLTDWEAEQDRIREEKAAKIQSINDLLNCNTESSEEVQRNIDYLGDIERENGEVADLIDRVGEQLQAKKIIALDFERKRAEEQERIEKERIEAEKQKAERKRLEKEKEEAYRIEREKQIAETARIEAEKKAEAEQLERERLQQEQIKNAQKEAEEAKKEAERIRIEGEAKERARVAQIEADKVTAQKERERAVQEEKNRQRAEQERLKSEQLAREADLEHRKAVNNKALKDIMVSGITEDQAKEILKLIVGGFVSNVKLTY